MTQFHHILYTRLPSTPAPPPEAAAQLSETHRVLIGAPGKERHFDFPTETAAQDLISAILDMIDVNQTQNVSKLKRALEHIAGPDTETSHDPSCDCPVCVANAALSETN